MALTVSFRRTVWLVLQLALARCAQRGVALDHGLRLRLAAVAALSRWVFDAVVFGSWLGDVSVGRGGRIVRASRFGWFGGG